MHSGPIGLPPLLLEQCLSLINLGGMLRLYDIRIFMRVIDVHARLARNQLSMLDLMDIKRLCSATMASTVINQMLRDNIDNLSQSIDLFIQAAACPTHACSVYSHAAVRYDD